MMGFVFGMILVVSMVTLGIKGFQPQGIPWTSTQYIQGTPAKLIGALCIALGLLLAVVLVVIHGFHLLAH